MEYEFDSLAQAFDLTNRNIRLGRISFDGYDGSNYWINNVIINLQPSDNDVIGPVLDLGNFGFTRKRWQKFLNEYLEPMRFTGWLDQVRRIKKGQEISYQTAEIAGHSLGNCLMGMTVHSKPWQLTVFSRTTQWVPTAALDLSFIGLTAAALSETQPSKPQFHVTWVIAQLQYHLLHSLILNDRTPYIDPRMDEKAKHAWDLYDTRMLHESSRKSFARLGERMDKVIEGTAESFIPTIPQMLLLPDVKESLSVEQLCHSLDITRRDLRYILRPYRRTLKTIAGVTSPESYDLRWPTNHPELKAIEWSVKEGRKVTSQKWLFEALEVTTVQALQELYSPFV